MNKLKLLYITIYNKFSNKYVVDVYNEFWEDTFYNTDFEDCEVEFNV